MAEDMSIKHIPLTIIVAATPKNGIGKNGSLPWPMLKKEMAYFARITKRVPMPTNTGSVQSEAFKQSVLDGSQRNAVIMGRKTWESIPSKLRPLKERTNVVITSQTSKELGVPDNVTVASDISTALQNLENLVRDDKALPVGRAFIIGGARVYEDALKLPQLKHILLTRINKDYDCDTFFPAELESGWRKATIGELRDFASEDVPEGLISETANDEEVEFEYQLYERS